MEYRNLFICFSSFHIGTPEPLMGLGMFGCPLCLLQSLLGGVERPFLSGRTLFRAGFWCCSVGGAMGGSIWNP